MNVIGIVQTDLNEFTVLYEQDQQNNQQNQQQNQQSNQQNQQGSGNDSPSFFSLLGGGGSSGDQQQQQQQQQQGSNQSQGQNSPQEMTVRIKGIPEGQKAAFLQMYQIIEDAKQEQELQSKLTIVSRGDDGGQGSSGGQQNQGSQN